MKNTDKKIIISIGGLCGSGKTTLSNYLAKKYGFTVFKIGTFRKRWKGENMAWFMLSQAVHNCTGYHIVIETVGTNHREYMLDNIKRLKIFLDAPMKVLDKRINKKSIFERGWFNWTSQKSIFKEYKDKKDFNRKMLRDFNKVKKKGVVVNADRPIEEVIKNIDKLILKKYNIKGLTRKKE